MLKVFSIALTMCCLTASSASAQSKIFVSATGNDANDGSLLNPKRSFQAAHASVADSGSIVVLDTAGYGPLNITKSVSIVVPSGVNGFITVSGNATAITINGNFSTVVSLQGLIIEGGGSTAQGIGVEIGTMKTVTIEDTQIRNFQKGIETANLTSNPNVVVTNYGLEVRRTNIQQSANGIVLITPMNVLLRAHVIDTSVQDTGVAYSTGRGVQAVLTRSEITRNGTGLLANQYSAVTVDACKLSYNFYAFDVSGGGTVYTYSNNAVAFNINYVYGASDLTPISAR